MQIRGIIRQTSVALKFWLVFTVILGLAYPVLIWAIGLALPQQGEITNAKGQVVANSLLVQTNEKIQAAPAWFHARPSAADWNASGSTASNLGPNSPDLLKSIKENRAAVAIASGVGPALVPGDAITSSGSGLDPDISVMYAAIQVNRVAKAHNLEPAKVSELVRQNTSTGVLAFFGQPSVNVTSLNVALADLVAAK